MKVDPKLVGQWKEKEKVLCLVANGRKEKDKVFFYLFPLSPKQLYLDFHVLSFDIKVLLYHGPRPLFSHSLPFLWPINYNRVS